MTSGELNQQIADLRERWELTPHLRVGSDRPIVVAGAYKGLTMALLARLFLGSRIIGFEPQTWAYAQCRHMCKLHKMLEVHPYGLLAGEGAALLWLGEYGTDAASVLTGDRETGKGWFTDAALSLDHALPIELFVMNMEGYEYHLLPYLHTSGVLSHINSMAVQFHDKYERDKPRIYEIMTSHFGPPVYERYPAWVYWVRQ